MQYCSKCNVRIRGHKRCCPLCQGTLSGSPEDAAFPPLKKRKYSIITSFKIALFILVTLEVVLMVIQLMTGFRFRTPGVIMAWAPLVLVDLCLAFYFRGNLLKLISYQAYLIMAFCLCLDRMDGIFGFSICWAIPITLVCLTLAIIMAGLVLGLHMADYMIYLIINIILALLQLLPVLLGQNPFPYPAVISIGIMVILASFVVIFRPRDLGNAFSKYMNV